MLVPTDHQIHRLAGVHQLLGHGHEALVRATVLGSHVGQDDEGIGLGPDLVIVAQHGLCQILELQPGRGPLDGDDGGFIGGQADDAQGGLVARCAHRQGDVRAHPVRVIHGPFQQDVGRHPGEGGLGDPFLQDLLALVELVVPHGRHLVAHHVVDVNGALPQQQLGDGRGGQEDVAGVQQDHVVRADLGFDLVDVGLDVGRATATLVVRLQAAVEVVGVEDGDLDSVWRRRRLGHR